MLKIPRLLPQLDDELLIEEFHSRSNMPKNRANGLLRCSKNYERTQAYRGHQAKVVRHLNLLTAT
ncbi:MAG: hypothetical protein QM533_00310 [Cytophagales bacterium]|nr:hypothetical protein [Cytophagales bacterium]